MFFLNQCCSAQILKFRPPAGIHDASVPCQGAVGVSFAFDQLVSALIEEKGVRTCGGK